MTLNIPQSQKQTTPKIKIFGILNKSGYEYGIGSLSLFGSPTNIWDAQPQFMSQIIKNPGCSNVDYHRSSKVNLGPLNLFRSAHRSLVCPTSTKPREASEPPC